MLCREFWVTIYKTKKQKKQKITHSVNRMCMPYSGYRLTGIDPLCLVCRSERRLGALSQWTVCTNTHTHTHFTFNPIHPFLFFLFPLSRGRSGDQWYVMTVIFWHRVHVTPWFRQRENSYHMIMGVCVYWIVLIISKLVERISPESKIHTENTRKIFTNTNTNTNKMDRQTWDRHWGTMDN